MSGYRPDGAKQSLWEQIDDDRRRNRLRLVAGTLLLAVIVVAIGGVLTWLVLK